MDLILQPLKSELNWPLGVKRPLDFTRARPGSTLGNGLRWQIPFHLLEAFFYYTAGRMVVDLAFQDSRRWNAVRCFVDICFAGNIVVVVVVER